MTARRRLGPELPHPGPVLGGVALGTQVAALVTSGSVYGLAAAVAGIVAVLALVVHGASRGRPAEVSGERLVRPPLARPAPGRAPIPQVWPRPR